MHNQQRTPYPPGAPPQPGFVPPPVHTQTQVIHTVHTMHNFGPSRQSMICPSCHAQIRTEVKSKANTKTHLVALLLCLFLCWCCCCIPYCVDSCQSQNHYCPNCHAFLGTYN